MKYVKRTKTNIEDNFLKNLLIDRGVISDDIDYQKKYFNPTKENLLSPLLLDNIDEGFQMLNRNLDKEILLVIDCDVDGYTSSAALYNYLKEYKPEIKIHYTIPEGKKHGLDPHMEFLRNTKKYDLIICPDSSSEEYEFHKELKEIGYDVLILDHHLCDQYSENAVVINNQLSQRYSNKELCGAGVVYKFLQYCDSQFGVSYADNYLDLVALGQISDMTNLNTLENRYILDYGLDHIKNFGFKTFIKEQAYSIFRVVKEDIQDSHFNCDNITQISIAFYIAPLINALVRVGTQQDKETLFLCFINGDKIVQSTKRGCGDETETIAEQCVRNCANAKTRQNKEKDKAIDLLDIQIIENDLTNNKILILNAEDLNVSNTLTGLCAMGIAAKYKKPVLLGYPTPDGKYLRGSGRGQNESELKDFRQFLLDSNLMDFAKGRHTCL